MIIEQPLGHGLGVFSLYFPNKVDKDFFTVEQDLNTFADRIHNEFLEVIFATGIFGGFIYLLLIGLVVYRFWHSADRYTAGLLLVFIANFIQNFFSFSDFSILLLLAIMLASYLREQKSAELEAVNLKLKLRP